MIKVELEEENKNPTAESKSKEINLLLFITLGWIFLILDMTFSEIIFGIPNLYKDNLLSVFFYNLILFIIGFILFKISKSLSLKFNLLSKIHIILTIIIYIFLLSFIISKNFLYKSNIYFNSNFLSVVLIVGFFNIISTPLLLIGFGNKIVKSKTLNISSKFTTKFMISLPIIISLIINLTFGYLALLFSLPNEITVISNNKTYNIRIEWFLSAKEDATFIYHKPINFFLMERLNPDEIPDEILAENNDYY